MATSPGTVAIDSVALRRGALASAIPFLLISAKLFSVWFYPLFWDGIVWVKYAVGLALMEFVIAHSGIYFAGRALDARSNAKRIFEYLAVIMFYTVIAVMFSIFTGGIQLLMVFFFVMVGRLITIISASSVQERVLFKMRGIIGAVLFFSLLIFTTVVSIPRLGITPAISKSIDWGNATGIWISQPQRPIAMLAFYFLVLGLLEIFFFGSGRAAQTEWAKKSERKANQNKQQE